MKHLGPGFNFQPLAVDESSLTDNSPLLYNSRPLGRQGRVTVFLRTRRTLRRRLGVHDLGQIEGVFREGDLDVGADQMIKAINKMTLTQWRYLFPPEMKPDPPESTPLDCQEFQLALQRSIRQAG